MALIAERHGAVSIPFRTEPRLRLRRLSAAAREALPEDWLSEIHARASEAAARAAGEVSARGERVPWMVRPRAEGDAIADMLDRYSGARAADMSEADIRERAQVLARRGAALRVVSAEKVTGEAAQWERLKEWVHRHGGEVKETKRAATLEGWAARVSDPRWWRGQLRRYVARLFERGAIELGRVGAAAGQWYCSNRAVKRRILQSRENEAMLRSSVIENASGQKMTLWEAASRSVSNKAIRRGELMTRIRGCEEWADAAGLSGLFTTNTCPSRYHAQRKGGGPNPRYDGSTPAEAQRWLSQTWARLRSKWGRDGVRVMGFRVAEPHHDGCPHWHMLIWCDPAAVDYVKRTMREAWLKDAGDEPGAAEHRCKVVAMRSGQAAGYIAKYIAKNIDDTGVDGHSDHEEAPAMEVGPDLLGDMEIKPSQRVEAWASVWRIRQFQAIGQPPVTVWRELRRVTLQQVAAASDAVILAWRAAHRERERRASWCDYMRHQGGAMLARRDYRLCVHRVERECKGRYETVRVAWACGVQDRAAVHVVPVTPSQRTRWGAEGFASRVSAAPWTRFNNCTRHNRANMAATLESVHQARQVLCLGDDLAERGPP